LKSQKFEGEKSDQEGMSSHLDEALITRILDQSGRLGISIVEVDNQPWTTMIFR
jgi:hypothetical protein